MELNSLENGKGKQKINKLMSISSKYNEEQLIEQVKNGKREVPFYIYWSENISQI